MLTLCTALPELCRAAGYASNETVTVPCIRLSGGGTRHRHLGGDLCRRLVVPAYRVSVAQHSTTSTRQVQLARRGRGSHRFGQDHI